VNTIVYRPIPDTSKLDLPIWLRRLGRRTFGVCVLLLGIVGSTELLPACHETPQAAIAQAIDLTNAICSLAPDSPVGQPYVDLICSVTQSSEQLVSVIIGTTSGDAGAPTATTASVPVTQIRIRLPAASAQSFLAAHMGGPAATDAGH
jgi:hypothetical protein